VLWQASRAEAAGGQRTRKWHVANAFQMGEEARLVYTKEWISARSPSSPVPPPSRAPPARPAEDWGRFLPEQTTAVSLLDRLLHHASVVVTDGESYRMREAREKGGPVENI